MLVALLPVRVVLFDKLPAFGRGERLAAASAAPESLAPPVSVPVKGGKRARSAAPVLIREYAEANLQVEPAVRTGAPNVEVTARFAPVDLTKAPSVASRCQNRHPDARRGCLKVKHEFWPTVRVEINGFDLRLE